MWTKTTAWRGLIFVTTTFGSPFSRPGRSSPPGPGNTPFKSSATGKRWEVNGLPWVYMGVNGIRWYLMGINKMLMIRNHPEKPLKDGLFSAFPGQSGNNGRAHVEHGPWAAMGRGGKRVKMKGSG